MFIQLIEGKVVDADGLERQMDRWRSELMPEAIGFLGSTSGVTPDGRFVVVARFSSQEEAAQNSGSDRQSQWWAETEKMLEDVSFTDLPIVETWNGGGSDDAGFVQVMTGKVSDVAKARELDKRMTESMPADFRPDMMGGTSAYNDSGVFAATMYFTSEAEAREGEKKMNEMEPVPEMEEWGAIMAGEPGYLDLPNPIFITK